MDIILTRVRLMDTMGRDGSRAVSSLAQGRGITATTGQAGVTGLAMATTDHGLASIVRTDFTADTLTGVLIVTGGNQNL